jgi:4-aminobutyrate aminotransferase
MHTKATHKAPHIVVPPPGPKAWAWIERDDQVISPSYTRAYPLVCARGHGCTIEDVDGNLFLDFTAGIAVTATGHAHPDVVAAIADQASRLIHMSGTDFYYAPEIELAERLAKLAPGDEPKRVFFCNSGAEAIEAALKLARYETGRENILSFLGAFHGRTYGAMSLGGSKAIHRHGFGPMVGGMHHIHYDCERAELEEQFATVCPADEVAAIFVEPIQGEGGYRVPSPRFLPMLREVCDKHGILLVVDEVQSGIGRTGKMFAVEHFGVVPDIVCIAKGIASGMPLGAIVTKAELMNWPPGSHASTFGGNPISCRAALATLDLVEGSMMRNAAERGKQLTAGLKLLAADPATGLAAPRGFGLMQAIDVTATEGSAATRRHEIIQQAFKQGLLLLGCGKTALRICPALCVTAEEVEAMLDMLHDICRRVPLPSA